jgi:type III pantothenate kinase
MLAALDISNSRISVGIFKRSDLCATFSLATDVRRPSDEYRVLLAGLLEEEGVPRADVRGVAIASVVPPLTDAFQQLCSRLFRVRPLVVGAGLRTGVRIATHNPRELGTDRVVNAVAVHHLVQGPAIVVDFSTATTFDVVDGDGTYLGSAIAPGLELSAEALFQHTSRLQRVDLARPVAAIGKDTATALQSGLLLGHVALVEGMIVRLRSELARPCEVVATGELAPLMAREAAGIDRVEPRLTLMGLRLLYEMNQEIRQ